MTDDLVLPSDNRTGPNCGVTAVAVLAGVSFETAWNWLGRNKAKTWKGWLWASEVLAALKKFGVRYRKVGLLGRPRLGTLSQQYADDPATYLAVTGSHFCVLRGATITDQQGTRPVSESSFAKCHVKALYRVLS